MSRRLSARRCALRIVVHENLEPRVVLTAGVVPSADLAALDPCDESGLAGQTVAPARGTVDTSGAARGVVVIDPKELGEPGMGLNLDKPADVPISTPVDNGFAGVPEPPSPHQADLSVQFVGVPDSTPAGSVLTYTVELANSGTEFAENVVVTLAMPRDTTFTSSGVTAGTYAASTGRWIVGSFGPGVAILTLRVSVDADAAGRTVRALPLVTSTTPDPDPFNNVAMFNTRVIAAAANSPPVISSLAVTPASIIEGGTAQLTGTFSDPDAHDALLLRVDWDGDGAFDEEFPVAGGAFAFGNQFPDDPQGADAYNILVELEDGSGGIATEIVAFQVANDPPVVSAGADATDAAGEVFSRTVTFTDAGDDAPWTAVIDWGDGTPAETIMTTSRSFMISHVFASAGASTVTVTVDDGDGGVGSDSFAVTRAAGAATIPPSIPQVEDAGPGTPNTVSLEQAGDFRPFGTFLPVAAQDGRVSGASDKAQSDRDQVFAKFGSDDTAESLFTLARVAPLM